MEKPSTVTYQLTDIFGVQKIVTYNVISWDPQKRTVTADRCEPQSTRPRVIDFDQVIEFEFAGCVNDLIK
jgi:hypothetical protein